MDPITIGLLAGGGMGLLQGQQNEKKMYQDMMLKAEMAKYAPYSAMAQNIASGPAKDLPDQAATLFSGAATGASAGNLFGKAGAAQPAGALGANKWSDMETLTPEQMAQLEMQQKMQTVG